MVNTGTLKEGIRLFRLKRWELALNELLMVNTEKFDADDRSEYAYYLGLCYTKLNKYEDALMFLEQVVTAGLQPLRVYQCRLALAYIYIMTKRSKMAEFELNRLVSSGFESAQLYTTLAYAACNQKQEKRAIELYEKALDLDENNTTAMNGLGFLLVDTDTDLVRGLRLCKRAVDRNPNSAAYLDSLGWAYFKAGEILEARTWLRRALDIVPRDPDIKSHMRSVMGDT
ncbi:tetratricopeptide repeat protein [Breznakiellaceae bacterium SP9]